MLLPVLLAAPEQNINKLVPRAAAASHWTIFLYLLNSHFHHRRVSHCRTMYLIISCLIRLQKPIGLQADTPPQNRFFSSHVFDRIFICFFLLSFSYIISLFLKLCQLIIAEVQCEAGQSNLSTIQNLQLGRRTIQNTCKSQLCMLNILILMNYILGD